MWSKIKNSLLFLLVGLFLFVFGGFHIITLIIIPHIQALAGRRG